MTKQLDYTPDERSSCGIDIVFRGFRGVLFTPKTCQWTLSDIDGNVINERYQVEITPTTSEYTISLAGADLPYKEKASGEIRLQVEGTYDNAILGNDQPFGEELRIFVQNRTEVIPPPPVTP